MASLFSLECDAMVQLRPAADNRHLTLRQAPVHCTSLFSCKPSEHRPRVLPKAFQRTWLGNWVHVATIPGSCPRHSAGLHRGEGLIAHAVASSRLTGSSGAAYALASTTTTTFSQAYTRTRAMAQQHPKEADTRHLSEEKRRELDEKARQGETVVPGGTGGKSLEAQERLAEGRSRGGQTRSEQLGTEGYEEMGRKGGLSSSGKSSEEVMAEKGVDIDESKFKTKGQ